MGIRALTGRANLILALCYLGALLALLVVPSVAHAAQATDDDVRRVARQLQCPVCEGQTVADSNSGLARDMRDVIRSKLATGESDQQILDEFVASYGETILTEPPKSGLALGVWVGPIVGFAAGAVLVTFLLTRWSHGRGRKAQGSVVVAEPAVLDELSQFRREIGA